MRRKVNNQSELSTINPIWDSDIFEKKKDDDPLEQICMDAITPVFNDAAYVMANNPTPYVAQLCRIVYNSTFSTIFESLYMCTNHTVITVYFKILEFSKKYLSESIYYEFAKEMAKEINEIVSIISEDIMLSMPAFITDNVDINDVCISKAIHYTTIAKRRLLYTLVEYIIPANLELYYDFAEYVDNIMVQFLNALPVVLRTFIGIVSSNITSNIPMFTVQDKIPSLDDVFSYDIVSNLKKVNKEG